MIILMMIETLKNLRHSKHNKFHELFRDSMIAFIPIVNTDSYIYINENWSLGEGAKNEDVLMIRKNRNISASCTETSGGVDLNRNYDYKFALDNVGSSGNPC